MRRTFGNLVTLLCLGLMLFAIGALVLPTALGYKRFVITGGSMTGAIPKGAIIYSRMVPTGDLKVGDVITFVPPDMDSPVTHRITSILRDKDGHQVFATKGDYNASEDPWQMHLVDPVQARYSFHIPYLGYGLAMLATRQARMLLIGLPAIVVALSLLWSLWRQAGEEVARQEAEATGVDGASLGARDSGGGGGSAGGRPATGVLALEWDGPDPFDGRSETELADLRGWWA